MLRKGNAQDLILYSGVSPMKKNVNYAEEVGCPNFKLQQRERQFAFKKVKRGLFIEVDESVMQGFVVWNGQFIS